jgi:hypothetical protein
MNLLFLPPADFVRYLIPPSRAFVPWRFPDAGRVGGECSVTAGVWKPSHRLPFRLR